MICCSVVAPALSAVSLSLLSPLLIQIINANNVASVVKENSLGKSSAILLLDQKLNAPDTGYQLFGFSSNLALKKSSFSKLSINPVMQLIEQNYSIANCFTCMQGIANGKLTINSLHLNFSFSSRKITVLR